MSVVVRSCWRAAVIAVAVYGTRKVTPGLISRLRGNRPPWGPPLPSEVQILGDTAPLTDGDLAAFITIMRGWQDTAPDPAHRNGDGR